MLSTMQNTLRVGSAPAERRRGVQAIARAGSVLRALERSPEGLALGEIAAATELPKSTAHRIVGALVDEGLLAQSGDGRISLGGGVARLAAARREAFGAHLHPLLLNLRTQLDETVDLAVLDGASARFVDQAPAPRRLRAASSIGEAFPLHCTANGKALLAAMPDSRAIALLPERLPELTPRTISSRAKLLAELARVREDGVAFDREEHTIGICAVGAAITDGTDPAAAAISVPVPIQRFTGNEQSLAAAIQAAAAAAAALLTKA
jgi:DNA-binding IclR family transcriptional regulator